jgi:hypothetical protein
MGNLIHKFVFYVIAIVLALIALDVLWHIFISGIQIMLFGFRMAIPLALIGAALYMYWHAKKFFKKD